MHDGGTQPCAGGGYVLWGCPQQCTANKECILAFEWLEKKRELESEEACCLFY